MEETVTSTPEGPKKSNTGLIIGIVSAVVLCCCCVFLVIAWQFGDQIMQQLGI